MPAPDAPPLDTLAHQHAAAIGSGWLSHDVSMVRCHSPHRRWSITYDAGLTAPRVAVAVMLHVLELGWPGSAFRLRFPLPSDDSRLRHRSGRALRDYRIPYRLALRLLVPDELLAELEREQVDPREAAERAGVTVDDLEARVRDWRTPPAPTKIVDLAELRARGVLSTAAEVAAAQAPPPPPEPPAIPAPPIKRRKPGMATERHLYWSHWMKVAREEAEAMASETPPAWPSSGAGDDGR